MTHKNLIIRITDENNEVLETFDLAEAFQTHRDENPDISYGDGLSETIEDTVYDIHRFLEKRFQPST